MEKPVSALPTGWTGWIGGTLIALFTIVTTYLVNRRKVRVDESALVLTKWKELYDAHEKRIATYEKRIEGYERRIEALTGEITLLRDRLSTAEDRILALEHTIIEKDKYIAGLEAQIGQITQSSAVILTGNHASDDISGAAERSAEKKGKRK